MERSHRENSFIAFAAIVVIFCFPALAVEPHRSQVSVNVQTQASRGVPVDALVLLDDSAEARALAVALPEGVRADSLDAADYGEHMSRRSRALGDLKRRVVHEVEGADLVPLADYAVLPIMHIQIRGQAALARLKAHGKVLSIDENRRWDPFLTESLPLINQPTIRAAGYSGSGTTVCVLDTGVDYTRAAFGNCSAPGTPASCQVAAAVDMAPDDGMLDDPAASTHGTNVAAIVLGVAPAARVAVLDVFSGAQAANSDILAGMNWCIANRATYNIVAINLSLGGGRYYSAVTPSDSMGTAIKNALDAGIITVAATGNNGYADSIALPAAYSNAISVGAVYDSAFGQVGFSACSDTAAKDRVACFSNSASFMTMLAPGSAIAAGGLSMHGTSQATPHVAGAIAVLAAAAPGDSAAARISRLKQGTSVTDWRNGIAKPRLNLTTALAAITSQPQPAYGTCPTVNCRESYGGWRVPMGLR